MLFAQSLNKPVVEIAIGNSTTKKTRAARKAAPSTLISTDEITATLKSAL
jgi:hypothetical protein